MLIFKQKTDLQEFTKKYQSIGFVPTMGALHHGHLSLIERSVQENLLTVVSIFVNPTQFNNIEDLEKYPRTIEKDSEMIEKLNKNIIIFAPDVQEIYGDHIVSDSFFFNGLDSVMEGTSRPGHFNGVGTVVKKLFEIVQPNKAYFGEKDYQQLLIIKSMVNQARLNVEIIPCPIIREKNGLAMSSRNLRLSLYAKNKASLLYETLIIARDLFKKNVSISNITSEIENIFKKQTDFDLEYFVIADAQNLQQATKKEPKKDYRAFIVAHIEGVRLIDNIALDN